MVPQDKSIPEDKIPDMIAYWQKGAEDDLNTAKDICHKADRYGASLFFLHLSIEKSLKSFFVKKHKNYAPLTHNLLSLAKLCEIELTPERENILSEINEFNMASRYPSEKNRFYSEATKEFADEYLTKGTKLYLWISDNLKKLP